MSTFPNIPTFNHTQWDEDFELYPEFGRYANGRLAIQLYNRGELFGTVTVNLPDQPLPDTDIFVKSYSENELVVAKMVVMGWLVPTGTTVPSGFVNVPTMRLGGDLLDFYNAVEAAKA
jgi:hypothetical protein